MELDLIQFWEEQRKKRSKKYQGKAFLYIFIFYSHPRTCFLSFRERREEGRGREALITASHMCRLLHPNWELNPQPRYCPLAGNRTHNI